MLMRALIFFLIFEYYYYLRYLNKMSQLSERILKYLSENDIGNTLTLAKEFNEDHQKVIGALKSIEANGDLVIADPKTEKTIEVTDEGRGISENGK